METKKIAKVGMFVAAAFVLSYVESLYPLSFGICILEGKSIMIFLSQYVK